MSVTVYVSATLRVFVNRNQELKARGNTIKEVLENLRDEYPELEKALFEEDGRIRPFVAVYVNEKNVTGQQETALQEGDILRLLPAIAGGLFNTNVSFGGTSLIIIVGVVLETIQSIDAQLAVRTYKGFLG